MSIKFTKEELEKRFKQAPSAVLDLFSNPEGNETIQSLITKYVLEKDIARDLVYEITITTLGFSSTNELLVRLEEILQLPSEEVREVYDIIDKSIFSGVRTYIDKQQKNLGDIFEEKVRLGILDKNNSFSSADVLNAIENPSLSIQGTSSAGQNLGGFTSSAPAANPASNIAAQLDQKLSSPAATAPREIYQVKKPDPYHEPII